MVAITNREAKELRKMGVKDGENGISSTHSHHKSYYLCDTKYNIQKLNKIRGI